jgi:hypothetical protein
VRSSPWRSATDWVRCTPCWLCSGHGALGTHEVEADWLPSPERPPKRSNPDPIDPTPAPLRGHVRRYSYTDCLTELPKLADASIDAIITNPPFEIAYQKANWDRTGATWQPRLWSKLRHVLQPGGSRRTGGLSDSAASQVDPRRTLPPKTELSMLINARLGVARTVTGSALGPVVSKQDRRRSRKEARPIRGLFFDMNRCPKVGWPVPRNWNDSLIGCDGPARPATSGRQ